MLTANAITGFRNYVKKTVAYARYKVGSNWYRADLANVYVDGTGKVAVEFVMDPEISGTITVTSVQLYDTSGNVWLETAANISRKSSQEGIFYRFTINIYET